jgi:hypothetical protein
VEKHTVDNGWCTVANSLGRRRSDQMKKKNEMKSVQQQLPTRS